MFRHVRLCKWAPKVRNRIRHLSQPPMVVLALWSFGIVLGGRCTLSAEEKTYPSEPLAGGSRGDLRLSLPPLAGRSRGVLRPSLPPLAGRSRGVLRLSLPPLAGGSRGVLRLSLPPLAGGSRGVLRLPPKLRATGRSATHVRHTHRVSRHGAGRCYE